MRASILKISIIILVVAVTAQAQTMRPSAGTRIGPAASDRIARDVGPALKEDPVSTTRDAQGIWHITGGTLYEAFEAMGYAVTSDRLFQMELYRRSARGTMSELFGAEFLGVNFLNDDLFIRNFMYSEDEYDAMFAALSEDGQAVVTGFTNGINRRILEIYSNFYVMPYEYWIAGFFSHFVEDLGYTILPSAWSRNDVLAWLCLLQRNFDPEGGGASGQLDNYLLLQTWAQVFPTEYFAMFSDVRWLNDPSAQTMIPASTPAKSGAAVESFRTPALPTISVEDFPDLSDAARNIRTRFDNRERTAKKVGAHVKMGSYAWAVSGDKTASGNPTVYSGPQMGFGFPTIVTEGSIRGGGLNISGMTVPGIPFIIVGRTPHHGWSMQVGHAHTLDYFLEAPQSVKLHRMETVNPAGGDPVTIPIFRSWHGPIIEPFPYNPEDPGDVIVSYAYAHWGREVGSIDAFLEMARATSIAEVDQAMENIAVSQHFTYADVDGNIAYWMSGFDPIRAPGVDPRFPQIGDGTQEWTGERRPRVHDSNPAQGYYGGWNNKASIDYMNGTQSTYYGPFHRAHVIDDYLSTHDNLTYEEIRDLALNIATTDSFGGGGNTWSFVADEFKAAVAANSTPDRDAAIDMLEAWDGHFVAGGPEAWRFGPDRADAWVFQDAWIREVMRLTFEDEFTMSGMDWSRQSTQLMFNVLIRALAGPEAALPTFYNWFQDKTGSGKPTDPTEIIIMALDNVIADIGFGPYGAERGTIYFGHSLLGALDPAYSRIHSIPFSSRSTFAHVIEYGENGPTRIESMWPLGPSGNLWFNGTSTPDFDPYGFSMAPAYDPFMPRPFPLFD